MAVNSQSFAWGAVSALCPSTERQGHDVKLKSETNRHHIHSPPSSKYQYNQSVVDGADRVTF